ncbi:hypothetical protein I302_104540 [Kwoniella bestiolae CBS 10118]|uniref:Gamma interferon inducible lysosomal thiol reductase n=1 Tax=Kwoniella bestiolae CBS 10118 TaxID=1296100 RepID=A0A1B9GBJ6_9TREE|nr:hypothetical protein I302_03245 [Kwoniella bestiolae CBS 10118]OCF28386.1 hypothetical protein I302_03245 [Kwoniella bestiolae CBS 10118]
MRSVLVLPLLAGLAASIPSPLQQPFGVQDEYQGDKVNVSLYVMSRCPDARLCENVFEGVIQKEGILDKINLDVGYIGKLNASAPLGVTCKHGTLECIGNAQQLCLYNHLPVDKAYAIVQCQNYPSDFPGSIGYLDSVKKCAKTVGVDWDQSGVGKCIERIKHNSTTTGDVEEELKRLGKEAKKLLRKNIKETYDRNVTTSCTIDISSTIRSGGRRRCVVDSGVWRGCDDGHTAQDFIRVIEEEYRNLQSKKDE